MWCWILPWYICLHVFTWLNSECDVHFSGRLEPPAAPHLLNIIQDLSYKLFISTQHLSSSCSSDSIITEEECIHVLGIRCHLLLYTRDGLHLPVFVLLIEESPVYYFVLLLWGDEVLDDQMSETWIDYQAEEGTAQVEEWTEEAKWIYTST